MTLGYGRTSTNNFSCSKFIVDTNGIQNGATHTTITAALGDASSPDTIFIRPGIYNEDITLKSGVNIIGFNGDGFSDVQAQILGKITLGAASDCSVKNLQIKTDSDYCIEDTGASSGSVRFLNCTLKLDSTGGINLNNANRTLTFHDCQIGRGLASIKDFNVTTCNSLTFEYCIFSGAATVRVASTIAAGELGMRYCLMNRHAIAISGTATSFFDYNSISSLQDNLISIDFDGGAATVKHLAVQSGTAAGINIGAGVTVKAVGLTIESSNADAISGTGTLVGPGAEFFGSSSVIASGLTWSTGAVNVRDLVVTHKATESDSHAFEVVCDANGFNDVKAVDIDYITGAVAAGENEEAILVNIDESASTGGTVSGYRVLSTAEGSAVINGYETGININPIVHESGTFGDADQVLNLVADVTLALDSGGAGNITLFVLDDDDFTIRHSTTWDEFEIILGTGASGGGVAPTFKYSTGGAGYTFFSPSDGTNGFRNTGAILWDSANLAGWATATSGSFEIIITRTRNTLATTPVIDELQISSTTEYKWDKNGAVNLNSLTLATDLAVAEGGTGLSTITDGGLMLGSGINAVTPLAQATNGQLPIGSTGADPVLAVLASADASVTITNGAGTIDLAAAGGGGGAWSYVSSTTISDDATIDFTSLPGTSYMFVLKGILPATDSAELRLRVDSDGGASFATADYQDALVGCEQGNAVTETGSGAAPSISLVIQTGNATGEYGLSGYIYVFDLNNAGKPVFVQGLLGAMRDLGDYEVIMAGGVSADDGNGGATLDVDSIRFLFSSGNLATGTIETYVAVVS